MSNDSFVSGIVMARLATAAAALFLSVALSLIAGIVAAVRVLRFCSPSQIPTPPRLIEAGFLLENFTSDLNDARFSLLLKDSPKRRTVCGRTVRRRRRRRQRNSAWPSGPDSPFNSPSRQ